MGEEAKAEFQPSPPKKGLTRRDFLSKTVAIIGGGVASGLVKPGEVKAGQAPQELGKESLYYEGKEIDEVMTYGDKNAFTYKQLEKLISKLNSTEREMQPETHYFTIFVTEPTYKQFSQHNDGESFQNFLKRSMTKLDLMFKEANPPLEGGVSLRRLISIKGKLPLDHYNEFLDLKDTIADSDGTYCLGAYDPVYKPKKSGYYHDDVKVDAGQLHEMMHEIGLPDHYNLDFIKDENMLTEDEKEIFIEIPERWQRYSTAERNDLGHNIMSSIDLSLNTHEALQLSRRIKRGLRNPDVWHKSEGFPNEVPHTTTLKFEDHFKNAQIRIYRTEEVVHELPGKTYHEKVLSNRPVFSGKVGPEGSVKIGNPFEGVREKYQEGMIDSAQGTLLLKIKTPDAKTFFHWMDIRDFNIAYWLGHEEEVTMKMNLASEADDLSTFDWTIQYESRRHSPPT